MIKPIVSMVLLLVAFALSAGQSNLETRTHYQIADRSSRHAVYFATTITAASEDLETETYLLSDPSGERVQIDIQRNYKNHTVTGEYRLNDGPVIRVKLDLPFKSTTRSGMIEEGRTQKHLLTAEVPVTLEAHGKVVKTTDRQWNNGQDKAILHSKAKDVVGPQMAAVMTKLRSAFGFPPLMGACTTLSFVTGGEGCAGNTDLAIATARPDCDFDAKFGMPCDSAQKQRAGSQPNGGKPGRY